MKSRIGLALCGLVLAMAASAARADGSLWAPENVSAWVDMRLAAAGGEKSWLKGGYGKLRRGGGKDGDWGGLAQAAILWTPRLTDDVTAHIMAQYEPDAAEPAGLAEAYMQWKPVPVSAWRYILRAGQFYLPVSQEHDGAGWTPTRTLTPSAIDSWVGEELLADAAEVTVRHSGDAGSLGLTVDLFTGDDTAGTVLAFRGWALGDVASAGNARLPLPTGQGGWSAFFTKQAPDTRPSAEVDGRGGYLVRLDWQPQAPVRVNLSYYNNQGTPTIVKHGQYGWDTTFANLGAVWTPNPATEVMAQYLGGATRMGGIADGRYHAADIAFDSAYFMVAQRIGEARLTGRGDYFAVKDHSLRSIDDNTEKGYAATVAWMKPLTSHLDFAVEGLRVISNRPARVTQSLNPRQAQTQVQVALKLHL